MKKYPVSDSRVSIEGVDEKDIFTMKSKRIWCKAPVKIRDCQFPAIMGK
jgi:uncharacterized secreted protein with C-terminal beta-propeller domain